MLMGNVLAVDGTRLGNSMERGIAATPNFPGEPACGAGECDLDSLVNLHHEVLYRFALGLTHSEADACDLVQETFYTLARRGFQLKDVSKAKSWLFTTLYRAFLQTARRQARFPHVELDESAPEIPDVQPPDLTRLDSGRLLEALAQLEPVYRAAVTLFYLEDLPYKEIARILDVPLGTVKSRIARAILYLREALAVEPSPMAEHGMN